jgi:hypothetical protein
MASKILKASNGVALHEAELRSGTGVLDRQYTVTTKLSPISLYQGPDKQAAEVAFAEGVAAARAAGR